MTTTQPDASAAVVPIETQRVSVSRAVVAGTLAALVQPVLSLGAAVPPVALELHHLGGALLYGAVGVHLLYGATFAVGFAVLTRRTGLDERGVGTLAAAGIGYGLLLWAATVAVAWPLLLSLVGGPGTPPVPYLHPHPVLGHALYGLALGVAHRAVTGHVHTG